MKRRTFSKALLPLGLALELAAAAPAGIPASPRPGSASLTVSAGISLKDALEEIQAAYAKEKPGVSLTFNFGSSGMLQQQIEQGAPVDVFLSAAPRQMDALDAKGLLLPGSRRNLLRNRLVLVVAKNGKGISSFADLARGDVKLVAAGDPASVPAGQYAQEALTALKLWEAVKGKAVLAKDVRQVLTYVETGNVDAGLVYRTDALASARVRIVAEAPEGSHSPILYPAAVVRSTKQPAAAREFVEYLSGKKSREIFEKYGFLLATP